MNHLKGTVFFSFLLLSFIAGKAQSDVLELECPLANGAPKVIRPSDKDYQKTSEYGVMFTSKTDTAVQAIHEGLAVIVARNPDDPATWDIVLQFKSYMFWYSGIVSPKIKQGVKVKSGTIISSYKSGDYVEVLMYIGGEPVINPRKYFKCK
jgi:hypothetical protein